MSHRSSATSRLWSARYLARRTLTVVLPLPGLPQTASIRTSGSASSWGGAGLAREKMLPFMKLSIYFSSNQAKILAELESEGSIHLSLVYRGSKDKADEFLATQDKLLDALYPKSTGSSSGTGTGTNAPAISSAVPESEGE